MNLLTPVHVCEVPAGSCGSQTRYCNPLRIDVFRVMTLEDTASLGWLTDVRPALKDLALLVRGVKVVVLALVLALLPLPLVLEGRTK